MPDWEEGIEGILVKATESLCALLNSEKSCHPRLTNPSFLQKMLGLVDRGSRGQDIGACSWVPAFAGMTEIELSVVLSNDAEVQKLNKTYRHQDKPTNVLSFSSDAEGELGDIILAYETVVKEAEKSRIFPLDHTTHLIIHGFLHLLGYDHESEDDALIMEAMEIHILKTLNIDNPYEDK